MSKKEKQDKTHNIRATTIHITNKHTAATWFELWTKNALSLYNSATFLNRNTLTALTKPQEEWHPNQQYAIQEIEQILPKQKRIRWKSTNRKLQKAAQITKQLKQKQAKQENIDDTILEALIEKEACAKILQKQAILSPKHRRPNYGELDIYYKTTNNEHYRILPAHAAQNILREVNTAWNEWGQALHDWRCGNSRGATGRPGIPYYSKAKAKTITLPAADITYRVDDKGRVFAIFPCTKQECEIEITNCVPSDAKLVTVQVMPVTDGYDVTLCYKLLKPEPSTAPNLAGGDVGLENALTIVVNSETAHPLIIDGKELKSVNRYWNKKIADEQSKLPNKVHSSKRIKRIFRKRSAQLHQLMNEIASIAVSYLVEHQVRTFVVGHGKGWKSDFARKVSKKQDALVQSFVQVPFNYLLERLSEKCSDVGIECIVREESYTSKASLVDLDFIPTFTGANKKRHKFSGRRVSRGVYRSSKYKLPGCDKGIIVNADVNGAGNILRKEFCDAFDCVSDWRYLLCVDRVRVCV